MRWIRSNGKIDIIIGRLCKEKLQVITEEGLREYELDTPFSLESLTDVIVTGHIQDTNIEVRNIYPITNEMQMAWDKETGVRLFYKDQITDEMHASGDYLYLTKRIEGKGCHLKIINSERHPYSQNGYQVFITQKQIQEQKGIVYLVQQIN